MEPIEAKIFVPITAPYTEEEIAKMSSLEVELVKASSLFKIVGEEQPITLRSSDREQIRRQVIELCEQYYPRSLFVKLNSTLNRTFLVDNTYHEDDPNAILEIVQFSCGGNAEQILEFISNKSTEYGWEFQSNTGCFLEYRERWPKSKLSSVDNELRRLNDKYNEELTHELESRFGLRGPFKKEVFGWPLKLYTTTSEIHTRDQAPVDISTLLSDYIEEKSRFIQKGMRTHSLISYLDYLQKFHPELRGSRIRINTKNQSQDVINLH